MDPTSAQGGATKVLSWAVMDTTCMLVRVVNKCNRKSTCIVDVDADADFDADNIFLSAKATS